MSLPSSFVHGYASASHQVEGAIEEDGKGLSVWTTAERKPGIIADGTNGDFAINSYHLYQDDIDLLKLYGAKAYRFSIAWPRVIPGGSRDSPVNEKGIDYYNKLIDGLLEAGIEPYVTIFHWDTPQALEDKYGGWTGPIEEISADFERYSRLLFERFGDRVKNWITLNEPICVLMFSDLGLKPHWDNSKDPWIAAHALIYSHALAVQTYRQDFKAIQGGRIGITLNCDWAEPIDGSVTAIKGAQKKLDNYLGWFADPIYLGHYPQSLVDDVGEQNMPKFTEEQWSIVKGSSEFFGLNHYSTVWVSGERLSDGPGDSMGAIMSGNVTCCQTKEDGTVIGVQGQTSAWLCDVPWGFRKLLKYLHNRYLSPSGLELIVTENGFCVKNEHEMPMEQVIDDQARTNYFKGYLNELVEAVNEDGINITGYFAWCLADNLEWMEGYVPKFGLTHVDLTKGGDYKRTPKDSAFWLKEFWARTVPTEKKKLNGLRSVPLKRELS